VVIHLRAANEKFADAVRHLAFVREVSVVENKLVVNLEDPEAHNPDLIRELVRAGADVMFVGELRHSLEDVYLQLMKNA
jgi:ABC-2 type transport system ATP-binding protein